MRILLVAATATEIRSFTGRLLPAGRENDHLSRYHYSDFSFDVLIPGIGMVSTAYFLGRQLNLQKYDLAINAGIAGAFHTELPIGSVVNVVQDCIPELGAEDDDKFLSVFDLGLAGPDIFPYKGGKLINSSSDTPGFAGNKVIRNLPRVNAITSNTVRGNAESIERIRLLTGSDIETMEGAAFFYACMREKIPCLQIRAISNLVEIRNRSRWNIELAISNLNSVLWDIISFHSVQN